MQKFLLTFAILLSLMPLKSYSQGISAVPFLLINPSPHLNGMAGAFTKLWQVLAVFTERRWLRLVLSKTEIRFAKTKYDSRSLKKFERTTSSLLNLVSQGAH